MDYQALLIKQIEAAESEALDALSLVGLTDADVGGCVSVSPNGGVACFSDIPPILLPNIDDSGVATFTYDDLTDNGLYALVGCHVLACVRYARYGCNPRNGGVDDSDRQLKSVTASDFNDWLRTLEWKNTDPVLLALLTKEIETSRQALHDPEKRKVWLKKRQRDFGRGKAGRIGRIKETLQAVGSYKKLLQMMTAYDQEALEDFNEADPPHECKLCEIEGSPEGVRDDYRLTYVVRMSGENKSVQMKGVAEIFRELDRKK